MSVSRTLLNGLFLGFFLLSSVVSAAPKQAPAKVAASPSPAPAKVAQPKWTVPLISSEGSVEFLAIGRPSALKVRGKATGAQGSFSVEGALASGEARFVLAGLDTGIGMRTKHMKDKYLEVEKFPESRLVLKKLVLPAEVLAGDAKAEGLPFEGVLTLHGVEKPVQGKVALERKSGKLTADAAFTVKIADYSIPNPGYAGITMADDVDVTVKFTSPIKTE